MNVRLDLSDHLLLRYGDNLESEAKGVILKLAQAMASPDKLAVSIDRHQRIAASLFFILAMSLTVGKGRLTKATTSKASRMIKYWHRPVSITVRPVLSIAGARLPHLWLRLDTSYRREYLNNSLSLPGFWNWINRTPKASDLVCSLAGYLARNWYSSTKAWEYVDELISEVPHE